MKIKFPLISMAAGFALVLPAQAGSHHFGGGGGAAPAMSAPSHSSSSHTAPSRSFAGRNFSGRNFAGRNFAAGNATSRNFAAKSATNAGPRMVNGRFNSGGARIVARQAASAHPNWNRHHDHFWHGHRCRFVNGSWVIFDFGFYDPFFWGYPYGYPYAYGYPYGYGYPYDGYDDSDDNGVYQGRDAGYRGSDSRDYNGSPVAVAQARLKRLGYYHGRVDGVMGPATQRAITEYQRDHGLRVTGSMNRSTVDSFQDRN